MSKKKFLELLLKLHGLTPKNVTHYRTDGCDGQYEIKVGWKGEGYNDKGDLSVRFMDPEGFESACFTILEKCKRNGLKIVYPS